ncbi:MAG: sulfurtransferase complex subunit TusB [Chloroflexi bacterium]|nr:sulfurtransferase complex subunit TusB [Chloroflexota bacterium]
MESVLMLINSAPSSVNTQRAWQLARMFHEQGQAVSLFLLQDGVLAALQGETALRDLPREICCYALSEDLQLRGFTPLKVREQVQVADYARLVDLFDQHTRVIGAL